MITRRTFGRLWAAAAGAVVAPALMGSDVAVSVVTGSDIDPAKARHTLSPVPMVEDGQLRSEFLLDVLLDRGAANNVGSLGVNRVVVPVSSGTFEGPKLKGTVVGPSGDWIIGRPDGSSIIDLRLVMQTDDGQKVYMTCRGIAYTQPSGTLYARIQPLFETGAPKYVWLNNVVAVGVYRAVLGKVAYRIYSIL